MLPQDRKTQVSINHRANLAYSLRRRLEVARSQNNNDLINILEQERKDLGLSL